MSRLGRISRADGLVDDVISCILDDGLGFLWFSSFQGIFRVSKQQLNLFANSAINRVACLAYGL